ncbi:MAG: MltA domain-containing protein [Gammaproteobacteria bacterium]|nr:MltA domain-containing protein [Gammaproteobacteria bacterium]MBU1414486.1 MltA domain-containing protein [Gammaproteobacteria bacterium]
MSRLLVSLAAISLLAACATPAPQPVAECPPAKPCASCPLSLGAEPAPEPEKPLQAADWTEIPGWQDDDLLPAFAAFRAECERIESQPLWTATCASARIADVTTDAAARAWFESEFRPWALVEPDGTREGTVTGYYEPLLKGSRMRRSPYLWPLFGPPEDLVVVDLAEVYPELKSLRLRGRLQGRKLVPYYTRAEWTEQEEGRSDGALMWIDDPLDLFFLQIQGSGQVVLDDGTRVRVSYADQNGHPFRSIGRWLIDQGEIKLEQASMQGIKAWGRANPQRLQEMLNANPSLVFFRELPAEGSGPPGALGVPLTPERSIAVDPHILTLGAPVFLATTWPNDNKPLQRLMLAQDTGGAIRGAVRADFYWGSGAEAGALAGKMRQRGSMWQLLPKSWSPK